MVAGIAWNAYKSTRCHNILQKPNKQFNSSFARFFFSLFYSIRFGCSQTLRLTFFSLMYFDVVVYCFLVFFSVCTSNCRINSFSVWKRPQQEKNKEKTIFMAIAVVARKIFKTSTLNRKTTAKTWEEEDRRHRIISKMREDEKLFQEKQYEKKKLNEKC